MGASIWNVVENWFPAPGNWHPALPSWKIGCYRLPGGLTWGEYSALGAYFSGNRCVQRACLKLPISQCFACGGSVWTHRCRFGQAFRSAGCRCVHVEGGNVGVMFFRGKCLGCIPKKQLPRIRWTVAFYFYLGEIIIWIRKCHIYNSMRPCLGRHEFR